MGPYRLYPAIVKENDDTNHPTDSTEQGRIQIYIASKMEGADFNAADYPWARPSPQGTGGSATHGVSSIPEKDSVVWVYFERESILRNAFYLTDVHLKDINPHLLFNTNVSTKLKSGDDDSGAYASVYPDVKFTHYANGINFAVSSNISNPEISIYHPTGTYIYINAQGEVKVKAKQDVVLSSDTGVKIKGGTVTLESTVLGETLKEKLEELIDAIKLITVPTGVGPSGTPINAASFTAIKTALADILSGKNKNN